MLEEDILQDDIRTTSKVTFVPSSEDNGKYLTCRAQHPTLLNSSIETEHKLDIQHSPILRLSLGSSIQHSSSIKEGTDVYFDCNIKANPWVTDIGWIFEDKSLLSNLSAGVIVNNQSLLLQKVTKEHRGRYQCVGTNEEGAGSSDIVRLEVQYAPVCKQHSDVVIEMNKDESTNLTCEVEADPTDCTFHWTLNNTADSIDVHTVFSNGTMAIITYTPTDPLDFGELLCWTRNSVGFQKHPCVIRIIGIDTSEETSGNPILGILFGVVGVLVVIAGILILIMRYLRGEMREVETHRDIEAKDDEAFKKEIEELHDSTGKGPDIIPPHNDPQYYTYETRRDNRKSRPMGTSYSTFSPPEEPSDSISSILSQTTAKPKTEDLYCEMSLPDPSKEHHLRQAGPSVQYAELDIARSRMPCRRPPTPDSEEDDFGISTEWPLVYNVQRNRRKFRSSSEYSTSSTPL